MMCLYQLGMILTGKTPPPPPPPPSAPHNHYRRYHHHLGSWSNGFKELHFKPVKAASMGLTNDLATARDFSLLSESGLLQNSRSQSLVRNHDNAFNEFLSVRFTSIEIIKRTILDATTECT